MERKGSRSKGKGLGGKERVSAERDGNSLGGKEMSLSGNGRE